MRGEKVKLDTRENCIREGNMTFTMQFRGHELSRKLLLCNLGDVFEG